MRRHEEVDILKDVEEEFIPPVLDSLSPPSDLSRDLGRDRSLLLPRGGLDALLGDERLQNPSVRVLGVAKIQQL